MFRYIDPRTNIHKEVQQALSEYPDVGFTVGTYFAGLVIISGEVVDEAEYRQLEKALELLEMRLEAQGHTVSFTVEVRVLSG